MKPPPKRPSAVCVDCYAQAVETGQWPLTWRPAPNTGPRCATHHRERKRAVKQRRAAARVTRVYGITLEEKEQVIAAQGGGCICAKWTGYRGQTRALSVDHDHATGLVRGVLCKHCNDLLGRIRDNPAYFELMLDYLDEPPAQRILGDRYVPEG